MKFVLSALAAGILTLTVAGCATTPPPQVATVYPDPPPRKPLDPKTQLETGRRY